MHNYYFADSLLQISDENKLICDSELSFFREKSPYSNIINVELLIAPPPSFKRIYNAVANPNITVDYIEGDRWLLSSPLHDLDCCLISSRDYSNFKCYVKKDEETLKSSLMQLLRTASECSFAYHNGLSIHASCVEYNEKAIVFTAPSGTGKSTQAELWENYLGAEILSGDRPQLRLTENTFHAYGVPWDGKEKIYTQKNFPIAAVVEIRRAKRNILRPLDNRQAFKLLLKQCFIPMWDDEVKFSAVKTIKLISKTVPFYRLFCLPEESAAQILWDAVFNNNNSILKEGKPDMKVKDGFILKNVVGEWIIMPSGDNIKKFEGAIVLNEIAAFIWKQLESSVSQEDLLTAILDEYNIDENTAKDDLDAFLTQLTELDILNQE